MADKNTPPVAVKAAPAKAAPKPKVDKGSRKLANLLKEISTLYRDAATALTDNDEPAFHTAMDSIAAYGNLFDTLSKKQSDAVTAEGLAAVTES